MEEKTDDNKIEGAASVEKGVEMKKTSQQKGGAVQDAGADSDKGKTAGAKKGKGKKKKKKGQRVKVDEDADDVKDQGLKSEDIATDKSIESEDASADIVDSKVEFKFKDLMKDAADQEKLCEYYIYNVEILLKATRDISPNEELITKLEGLLNILNCLKFETVQRFTTLQSDLFKAINETIDTIVAESRKIQKGEQLLVGKTIEKINGVCSIFMDKARFHSGVDVTKLKPLEELDLYTAVVANIDGMQHIQETLNKDGIEFDTSGFNMDAMYQMVNKVQKINNIEAGPIFNQMPFADMIDPEMALYAFSIECNDTIYPDED